MKKKIIGLSTLLLALLLGLFSNAYAFEYIITESDCDILAGTYFNGKLPTTLKDTMWTFVQNAYNTYNKDVIVIDIRNDNGVYFRAFSKSAVTGVYNAGNKNSWGVYLNGDYYEQFTSYHPAGRWDPAYWSIGSVTHSSLLNSTYSLGSGSYMTTSYLLISNDLGNSYTGPWQSSEVLNLQEPSYFEFVRNESLQYVNDNNIAIVTSGDLLGYIEQANNFYSWEVDAYYWDSFKNKWVRFIYESDILNDPVFNDERIYIDIAYIYNYYNRNPSLMFANCIYQNHFYGDPSGDFLTYSQPFILKDSHTVITNGEFDVTATFSGDYGQNYRNNFKNIEDNELANDRTEQTIDAINDIKDTITDDSEVDNIIGTVPTNSGDVANAFGYLPIENPFTTFLLNLVQRFYTTLTTRNKEYLNLNHHGFTTWTIDTDKFITPDGTIKTLIRTLLVFLWIFGNYKYFHYLITLLQTAKIDKAISELGTDEFYDSDIM